MFMLWYLSHVLDVLFTICEFPIDFCVNEKTCVVIQNTIKKLLQLQHSKLGQILHVDS